MVRNGTSGELVLGQWFLNILTCPSGASFQHNELINLNNWHFVKPCYLPLYYFTCISCQHYNNTEKCIYLKHLTKVYLIINGGKKTITIYRGCKLNILHHVLRFHGAINLEKWFFFILTDKLCPNPKWHV